MASAGVAEPQPGREARRAGRRWLRDLARPVRGRVVATVLCGAAGGLAVIAQALLIAHLVAAVAVDGAGPAALWQPMLLLVLVFLWRALCGWGSERLGIRTALAVKARLRREIRAHMAGLGPVRLRRHHSGGLASLLIEQVEALDGYFARYLPQTALAVLVPLAILATAFSVDWVVGLLFLVTGPLVPLFMALIGMGAEVLNERQFTALSRMSSHFLDRLRGLSTIRMFGRGAAEVAAIHEVAEDYRRGTMRLLRIAFLSSGVLEFFTAVSIGLVALYIGLNLLGMLDFGGTQQTLFTGLFLLLLAPEYFAPLRQLASHYHDRAAALGAAEGIRGFLQEPLPEAGGEAAPPGPPALLLRGVRLDYAGADEAEGETRTALAGADLQVAPGEHVALVGPSGGGKSSILALLAGFVAPTAGELRLGGCPAAALDLADWHGRIAWLGQQAHVLHGSLAENIALGDARPDPERLQVAARSAGVLDFARDLPQGLDTVVGENGLGLSGGQAQRVALARALYRPADLYLLDEPTARLDAATEARVLAVLRTAAAGRTLVVATHSPAVAAMADRVIPVAGGRCGAAIAADGTQGAGG
ncbi:thiol reductant ABC exporter subunit CydD [Marinibaculum pumilum]|uniref:Thiol reductant ABC exporter subunit CydD n=1 Tax=Marinibaculum pumilum TaxID=1766165 RepID=A0ABV7L6I4_9PROT